MTHGANLRKRLHDVIVIEEVRSGQACIGAQTGGIPLKSERILRICGLIRKRCALTRTTPASRPLAERGLPHRLLASKPR
jgi:hypothetical protein